MFGRISRKHLEAVPGLLERANDSLRIAEGHMRNRNCKNAIWSLTVAARLMGRVYESYESAKSDAYRHEAFKATTSRFDRLATTIADYCRRDV